MSKDRERLTLDIILRPPLIAELPAASALCLRSKAHWGYDETFIAACRDELTLKPQSLAETEVIVALAGGAMVGVAQLSVDADEAELDKLFIEPDWIGHGIGRKLFGWSVRTAETLGARTMVVTADPSAAPFYEKMGFERIGEESSGSIAGRVLPVYRLDL